MFLWIYIFCFDVHAIPRCVHGAPFATSLYRIPRIIVRMTILALIVAVALALALTCANRRDETLHADKPNACLACLDGFNAFESLMPRARCVREIGQNKPTTPEIRYRESGRANHIHQINTLEPIHAGSPYNTAFQIHLQSLCEPLCKLDAFHCRLLGNTPFFRADGHLQSHPRALTLAVLRGPEIAIPNTYSEVPDCKSWCSCLEAAHWA